MKVFLKRVRLSFPDLLEPTQYEGKGAFSYKASFIITPKQIDGVKESVKDVINQVALEKWKVKAPIILKGLENNSQKMCFTSGDLKEYDGYKGNFILSSSRAAEKGIPLLLNKDKSIISKPGILYAGCYVNASVDIWPQDNGFGKGIRATLLAVQFVDEGIAFSAGEVADENDFDDMSDSGEDDLS